MSEETHLRNHKVLLPVGTVVRKITFKFVAWAVTALFAGVVISRIAGNSPGASEHVTPLPILLTKVQSLGELHTARHTYQNVFEYETHRQPGEIARNIPGVTSLVRASTKNACLVSATGTVEAGLDLGSATIKRDGGVIRILLPNPKVYQPQVDAKLHTARYGVFWIDHNLALKAQRDARVRFKDASIKNGILEQAKTKAREVVTELLRPATDLPIEVTFA